jgi:hypothetical protein
MKNIADELSNGNAKKSTKESQEAINAQEKLATNKLLFAQSVKDTTGTTINIVLPTLGKAACKQTKRDKQQQKIYESFSVFTRQKISGHHYRDKHFMVTARTAIQQSIYDSNHKRKIHDSSCPRRRNITQDPTLPNAPTLPQNKKL